MKIKSRVFSIKRASLRNIVRIFKKKIEGAFGFWKELVHKLDVIKEVSEVGKCRAEIFSERLQLKALKQLIMEVEKIDS